MDLVRSILLITLALETSLSMRNFHIPHGYLHNLAMQHDNYQHYDSYSSEGVMVRSHRKKYFRARESDYSHDDSNHRFKNPIREQCKCSCIKCNKSNVKSCCLEFCSQQCFVQSNVFVVPYPVPFMVQPINQTMNPPTTTSATTTATTVLTTSTSMPIIRTISTTIMTESRKTLPENPTTLPFYLSQNPFNRFRIIRDKKIRRNMGNEIIPNQFDRLPKYGIVPIPENIAMSLMQQIRKNNNQNNNQFRTRLNLNKNRLDYAD